MSVDNMQQGGNVSGGLSFALPDVAQGLEANMAELGIGAEGGAWLAGSGANSGGAQAGFDAMAGLNASGVPDSGVVVPSVESLGMENAIGLPGEPMHSEYSASDLEDVETLDIGKP